MIAPLLSSVVDTPLLLIFVPSMLVACFFFLLQACINMGGTRIIGNQTLPSTVCLWLIISQEAESEMHAGGGEKQLYYKSWLYHSFSPLHGM